MGIDCQPSVALSWAVLAPTFGSLLKDPWIVLRDVFADLSNPNMTIYEFRTSNNNFIQNEQAKLDETCLNTEGYVKETLSNIIDVLGRLNSKLHENRYTDYIHHNNSFK